MEVVWKDIYYYDFRTNELIDYTGLYQVSTDGNIKSLERLDSNNHLVKEKILKKQNDKDGYEIVRLYKNRKCKNLRVHRLVAEMFIQNPENKLFVDHIIPISNGGTNNVNNLRWVTIKENNNNPITKEKVTNSKIGREFSDETRKRMSDKKKGLYDKKVVGVNINDGSIIKLDSMKQGKKFGFDDGNISKCCNKKKKSYKGYVWYFEYEYEETLKNELCKSN